MKAEETEQVAVITCRFRDFLEYIREQTNPKENYIFTNDINKIRGYRFSRFVKLHNYYMVNEVDEIIHYCISHSLNKEEVITKDGIIVTN